MLDTTRIILLKKATLEEQSNAQGYTLGENAEKYEMARQGIETLWSGRYINDDEMRKLRKALINNVKMDARRVK